MISKKANEPILCTPSGIHKGLLLQRQMYADVHHSGKSHLRSMEFHQQKKHLHKLISWQTRWYRNFWVCGLHWSVCTLQFCITSNV